MIAEENGERVGVARFVTSTQTCFVPNFGHSTFWHPCTFLTFALATNADVRRALVKRIVDESSHRVYFDLAPDDDDDEMRFFESCGAIEHYATLAERERVNNKTDVASHNDSVEFRAFCADDIEGVIRRGLVINVVGCCWGGGFVVVYD